MKNSIKTSASESTLNNSQQNSVLNVNDAVTSMNTCDCGCGFTVGSLEFIRLHVESKQEADQRLASEQLLAEQEAQDELDTHPTMCRCVRYN